MRTQGGRWRSTLQGDKERRAPAARERSLRGRRRVVRPPCFRFFGAGRSMRFRPGRSRPFLRRRRNRRRPITNPSHYGRLRCPRPYVPPRWEKKKGVLLLRVRSCPVRCDHPCTGTELVRPHVPESSFSWFSWARKVFQMKSLHI